MFQLRITEDLGFEFWKDIPGYEGKYQASTYGRVKSRNFHREKRESLLKQQMTATGYLATALLIGGKVKLWKTHRLVAMTFLPRLSNDHNVINHKDEEKTNNHVVNIEWTSIYLNNIFGTRNERMINTRTNRKGKTAQKKVVQIDCETGKIIHEFKSITEAGDYLGISRTIISKAMSSGKIYRNSIWKEKEGE